MGQHLRLAFLRVEQCVQHFQWHELRVFRQSNLVQDDYALMGSGILLLLVPLGFLEHHLDILALGQW